MFSFYIASKCGTHFLGPSEGYILSDKMFANQYKPHRCVWGFIVSCGNFQFSFPWSAPCTLPFQWCTATQN